MTPIAGSYFDGTSSRSIPATLEIQRTGGVILSCAVKDQRYAFKEIRISSRLGQTPRSIQFPDGSKFTTRDNQGIDQALEAAGLQDKQRWLHKMESKIAYVGIFAALTVVFCWGFVQFGVPYLAKGAAYALPDSTSRSLGQGALTLIDQNLLGPSRLAADHQQRLRRRFAMLVAAQPATDQFQLLFRQGRKIGANAFALPSGQIVVTDELVDLADTDDELVAVMAHEIGHVINRHALRRLIQDSLLALLVILVTGDLSASGSLVAALPTVLLETSYSRAFETEADHFASSYLCSHGLHPQAFKNILTRLSQVHHPAVPDYLSSHPATGERLRTIERACPVSGLRI